MRGQFLLNETKNEQSEFTERVKDVLAATSPKFDFRYIASLGLEKNLISQQEADRIVLFGQMPKWLTEALPDAAVRYSKSPIKSEILPRASHTVSCASGVFETASMSRAMGGTSQKTAPVFRVDGGASRHFLDNFRKLSVDPNGVIAELSDENGFVLSSFLGSVEPVRLPGKVLLCVVEGSFIYTHWLLDTLPRLLMLRDGEDCIESFDYYVFANTSQKFHQECIKRLGIPESKIRTRQSNGNFFEVEQYSYVSPPRTNFLAHQKVYELVREFFQVGNMGNSKGRRVFISRSKASRRKILNEMELIEKLSTFGFEVISFEDLSIEESAELISNASHVIAPHGAGLANLVFANSGTKVLEFFSAHLSHEYWNICEQRGLIYHAFQCMSPDGSYFSDKQKGELSYSEKNGQDMIVPIEKLVGYMNSTFI